MSEHVPTVPINDVQENNAVDSGLSSSKSKAKAHVPERIAKQMEALKAKVEKLTAEKQQLKSEILQFKSVNSRIRRIPKSQPATHE